MRRRIESGHIEQRSQRNGIITYRVVIPLGYKNGTELPRFTKTIGTSAFMTIEQAEQELVKLRLMLNGGLLSSAIIRQFLDSEFLPHYVDKLPTKSRKNDFTVTTIPKVLACFGESYKCAELKLPQLRHFADFVCS